MLLYALVAVASTTARAVDGPALPDLKAWRQELERRLPSEGTSAIPFGAFPARMVAVEEPVGEAPAVLMSVSGDVGSGCFRLVPPRDVLWSRKLNAGAGKAAGGEEARLREALAEARASLALVAPAAAGQSWRLVWRDQGKVKSLATRLGPPTATSGAALLRWVSQALGYDGVVLDHRGAFVLVAAHRAIGGRGRQALALADSAGRLTTAREQAAGVALLELVEAEGGYGVFRIVVDGKTPQALPRWTKVLIEDE